MIPSTEESANWSSPFVRPSACPSPLRMKRILAFSPSSAKYPFWIAIMTGCGKNVRSIRPTWTVSRSRGVCASAAAASKGSKARAPVAGHAILPRTERLLGL
jgi:hypothetical protein